MIAYTLPEIRHLLINLARRAAHTAEHIWAWSIWRRRRRHQARLCHYKRHGYVLT